MFLSLLVLAAIYSPLTCYLTELELDYPTKQNSSLAGSTPITQGTIPRALYPTLLPARATTPTTGCICEETILWRPVSCHTLHHAKAIPMVNKAVPPS